MNLAGRVALVTGGAVRIGRAICRALAGQGCDVVVHYNRSGQAADELVAELTGLGVTACSLSSGLGSEAQAESLMDAAWRAMSRVDILVNNAALFHKDSLLATDQETFQNELAVNLAAPVMLTRALARRLQGAPVPGAPPVRGKVINLLDRRVSGVEAGCVPYLLSKKGLADFTRIAALELAPYMTVNGVAPGAILAPPGEGDDYLKDLAGFIPLQRGGTPADIASAVLYLLESDVVTGQVIYVDGGQHLCGSQNGGA